MRCTHVANILVDAGWLVTRRSRLLISRVWSDSRVLPLMFPGGMRAAFRAAATGNEERKDHEESQDSLGSVRACHGVQHQLEVRHHEHARRHRTGTQSVS